MLQLSAVLVVVLGIVLLGVFGFGYIDEGMLVTLMGFIVAGGYAGFRQAIESTGYKTYILAGAMVVFGVIHILGYITLDKFLIIEGVLGIGGIATLFHASSKQGAATAANKIQ